MSKQSHKDVLQSINKKTGKHISESAIKKLASGVSPGITKNEDELRKLIKQVSVMANVKVTESTIQEIIKAVKASGLSSGSLESLMKMMMKK